MVECVYVRRKVDNVIRCDSHQIYRSRYDQLLLHLLVLQDKNTSIILEKEDRCSGMYVTAFRMYQIFVSLPSLLTVRCNFRRFWRALIVQFCLLFRPSRLVATSQSRRRDLRKVCLWQLVLTLRCPSGDLSLRQKGKGYLFFNFAASRLSCSASWAFSRACSSRAALLRTSRSYFSTSFRMESIRR